MKSKTFTIRSLNNKSSKVQTMIFEGDLGINNAVAIKKTIQAVTFNGDPVTFHLKNVEKVDITLIQTLRALKTALQKDCMQCSIISEVTPEIERLLNNTGFASIL
jgi:anti-anti-sigma regulatory factor